MRVRATSFGTVTLAAVLMPFLLRDGTAQPGLWTAVQTQASPPFRIGHGLATDPLSGITVLFGGTDNFVFFNDTWVFDGCAWSSPPVFGSPPVRWNLGMAPSPIPGRMLVFGGGIAPGVVVNETWEFDQAAGVWSNLNPPNGPSARQLGGMVYDSWRGRVVLFGGTNGAGAGFLGDTWEWNGAGWFNVTPASPGPVPRGWHSMAFDAARGRTVVYGGYNGSQLADTWEWDGVAWNQVLTATSPGGRSSGAMAYDADARRIILFAGSTGWPNGMNDTWAYDGVNWTPVSIAGTQPAPQYLHLMATDWARGGVLVHGAFGNGWAPLNDTWRFRMRSFSTSTLAPTLGSTVGIALSIPSAPGAAYLAGVSISGTCPGVPLPGGRIVPLNWDEVLALSISGLFPQTFQGFQGSLDPSGAATLGLAIPPLPVLSGVTLHAAAAAAAGPTVLSVTNVVAMTIQ